MAGLLLSISVILLTISLYFLMGFFVQERQDNQLQQELQELMQEKEDDSEEDTSDDLEVDAGILALHEENPDCIGWLTIDVPGNSDNLIIYGHHMNSGKMFADLEKYKDEGFYEEHPTILFRTIWGNEQYQIFVAFTTPVYTGNDFDYYSFIKAGTVEDYKKFVASVKEKSLYQTGTTAKYRDKLLTLSTCEYSQKNGRMVLVAKKNNGKLP